MGFLISSPAAKVTYKEAVRVASTVPVTLATFPTLIIDGVSLDTGDRVLLKNQTNPAANGIYVYDDTSGLSRSSDASSGTDLKVNTAVPVSAGSTNFDTVFQLVTDGLITLETTALSFTSVDAVVLASIAAETANRIAEDAVTLSSANSTAAAALAIETAARVAADSSEATTRANADTAEASARVAADLTKANTALDNLATPTSLNKDLTFQATFGLTSPDHINAVTSLTASTILSADASKNLVSLPLATYPSLDELKFVKGVTSNIQTQLAAAALPSQISKSEYVLATNGSTPYWAIEGVKTGYPADTMIIGQIKKAGRMTGEGNIIIGGINCANDLTSGTHNILIGRYAGSNFGGPNGPTTGSYQICIGNNAGGSGFNGVSIGDSSQASGERNVAIGSSASASGYRATAVGAGAGAYGHSGVSLGLNAGGNSYGGSSNTNIGAGTNTGTGFYDTTVGADSGRGGATGDYNGIFGAASGVALTTGSNNLYLGSLSGRANLTGVGQVCLGYYSGAYATASDEFYLNNQNRTDSNGDKAKSLMYGVFNATASSQTLAINADLKMLAYTEAVIAMATVGSTRTISILSGTVQTATLTASTACTFTMPTATAGKSFVLYLKQAAATGQGTATFTGVKWTTAGAPTITVTAGAMDILSFVSDGTNWYGSFQQGYTP